MKWFNEIFQKAAEYGLVDKGFTRGTFTVKKYADDKAFENDTPYEVKSFHNLLLNEGITPALQLIGGTAAPTAWNNANAYIGVGDDATAAAAGQTGLVAATNKAWAAMEASYPQVSAQTITFRSVFGSGAANYAWNEFTVGFNNDTGANLNRAVSAQGTKASGQTWTVDVAITLS